MPESYPYTISNNKIPSFFDKIRTAQRPERLSRQVLKHWGFTASNDRAFIPVLRGLGFIDDNGTPTELYNRVKGDTNWKNLLGEQVRELYSDLFATNTNINAAPDDEVKGAMARITGKDAPTVGRYFGTFKALATLARFDGKSKPEQVETVSPQEPEITEPPRIANLPSPAIGQAHPAFHYNIQIHLPATTDISVYNAIFKSLKEHLMI
jgi:hypothetical protein